MRFNRATHVATISPLFGDDPFTGHVTRVPLSGATINPKGLLFVGHAD